MCSVTLPHLHETLQYHIGHHGEDLLHRGRLCGCGPTPQLSSLAVLIRSRQCLVPEHASVVSANATHGF